MAVFVLAHGIFGFGDFDTIDLPGPLDNFTGLFDRFSPHYFNGVKKHLEDQGHTVYAPQVNPIGSIQQRGEKLKNEILEKSPMKKSVHILAHSMGGLDARYALANFPDFAECVSTLVTIGTPHKGSPVADAVMEPGHPLSKLLPPFIRKTLTTNPNASAPYDLTTKAGEIFDQTTPDVKGVRYANVAGDASKGGHELYFFQFAAQLGDMTGQINDGVVTRDSALHQGHEHLDDWPVDHAGEVGWQFPLKMTAHLDRYDELVAYCLKKT